ncbi:MAG: hypothetical protein C4K49_06625 [Candidatus Thorarchaeota archaeon]|nr:MAG: hypothetical protein C4K49_06625 [Candidatus Thorarchaeota archaeon]
MLLAALYVSALVWSYAFSTAVEVFVPQLLLIYAGFVLWTTLAKRSVAEYLPMLIVLCLGMLVWTSVFNAAVIDYMSSSFWNSRGVWLGNGPIVLFGYTINFQFEGYTDYSYFYVHWGYNMLNGVMPYNDAFGYLRMGGFVNRNGLYIFPPFYAYLYAAGIALPVDDWGIGLLLACFGYLTALPVYGIASDLSHNRHVGEAAALTYLLTPNVLYHTTFLWLNPSPFIFFFFSGFYMLVKGRQYTGTILIVTAALFKQTSWFLGIPLVVYLLLRPRPRKTDEVQTPDGSGEAGGSNPLPSSTCDTTSEPTKLVDRLLEVFDIRGFASNTLVAVLFVLAVMYPFLLAQPNLLLHLSLAAGGFPLESFTEPPPGNSPMRLQVLPVVAGVEWLARVLDWLVYYGFLIAFGTVLFAGLMLFVPKEMGRERQYFRRLLLLTMLMMLWVNLTGPRGVYKYYFTLFAPFFSIFSSARMVNSQEDRVPFSFSMLWLPVSLSLMILIPNRNVYLFGVILIFVGYLLSSQIGTFWYWFTAPVRQVSSRIRQYIHSSLPATDHMRAKLSAYIYPPRISHGISEEGGTSDV